VASHIRLFAPAKGNLDATIPRKKRIFGGRVDLRRGIYTLRRSSQKSAALERNQTGQSRSAGHNLRSYRMAGAPWSAERESNAGSRPRLQHGKRPSLVFGEMCDPVEAQRNQGSVEQHLEACFAVGTTIEWEAAFAIQF